MYEQLPTYLCITYDMRWRSKNEKHNINAIHYDENIKNCKFIHIINVMSVVVFVVVWKPY